MSQTAPRILEADQERLIAEARSLLGDLRTALAHLRPQPDDEKTLAKSIAQLDDLFLLVVAGEFNSGKSAFVNALLGERILEEGVTPTTSRIQVLRRGPEAGRVSKEPDLDVITSPSNFLAEISLVDTPGTNAIERRHEAIAREFVPRADLILFVTSADRPFTESERAFLEQIREWGKKIVAVVNKIDLVPDPSDREKIGNFVEENLRSLLGVTPDLFAVSARLAMAAKLDGDEEKLEASGFPALESYICQTLDEDERFRLKLLNPLGVGLRLLEKYEGLVAERLGLLEGDMETVEALQGQVTSYKSGMLRGFELRLAEIDQILQRFELAGHDFFDEYVRVSRVFDLMDKTKIQEEFERLVLADVPQQIERKVEEIIDWLVSSELGQWRALQEHFERRKSEHSQQIASRLNAGFEYDRSRLLNSVGRSSQDTLANYDRQGETQRMAQSVRGAVANAALLEVGAVGLGAAVTLAATSTAADITGLAAAGVMATIGFLVIPQKRRRAKDDLRARISRLRADLVRGLTEQFEREIAANAIKMEETIEPYTRFVRSEHETLRSDREELSAIREAALVLQSQVRSFRTPAG